MIKGATTRGEHFVPAGTAATIIPRPLRHWPLVIVHWSSVILAGAGQFTGSALASEPAPGAASAIARFAQLPLSFEANQGQTDERAQFIARGHDHTVFLGPEGATIALRQPLASTNDVHPGRLKSAADPDSMTRFIRMTLPGGKPNPTVNGLDPSRSRVN